MLKIMEKQCSYLVSMNTHILFYWLIKINQNDLYTLSPGKFHCWNKITVSSYKNQPK